MKNFIKINFPVEKYLLKHSKIISKGQTYPLLNFIKNISQWHHILEIIDNILYIFIMETIIAFPSTVNNWVWLLCASFFPIIEWDESVSTEYNFEWSYIKGP